MQNAVAPPAHVIITEGPLTHGDLEPDAYPLYVRYDIQAPPATLNKPLAIFENGLQLQDGSASLNQKQELAVTLTWAAETAASTALSTSTSTTLSTNTDPNINAFVHISGPDGLIGQFDAPAAQGRWSNAWWQPGINVTETRLIQLDEPFDAAQHEILVGLYDTETGERLAILEADGAPSTATATSTSPSTAVTIEPE